MVEKRVLDHTKESTDHHTKEPTDKINESMDHTKESWTESQQTLVINDQVDEGEYSESMLRNESVDHKKSRWTT